MSSLLIVGCGALGTVIAERRTAVGARVLCLSRNPRGLPRGATAFPGDVLRPDCFDAIAEPIDWVVYSVGPSSRAVQAYRDVYEIGLAHLLDWLERRGDDRTRLLLVSSTAVYAQCDGEWVDETSPAQPEAPTAKLLLAGEQRMTSRWANSVTLRLSGIYGPGRQSLLERAMAGLAPRLPGSHVVNRMHLEDGARAVEHLLSLSHPEPLYLGADDEPTSQQAVVDWLRTRFQLPPQAPIDPVPVAGAPQKRCSNSRLKASGFSLSYPTFREGYAALALAAGLAPK